MKVIFLDIDGVLNTENDIKKLTGNFTKQNTESKKVSRWRVH